MLGMTQTANRQKGFSLIEIAVVMVIVGLLLGSFIGTFSSRIDATKRKETQKELEEIKQVLKAYVYTRTPLFLPCPDTDIPPDGVENRETDGSCSSGNAVATLPWVDLGTGYGDAWGNRYSYWVAPDYSRPVGFDLDTSDVNTASIKTRIGNMQQPLASKIVAVVISRGKNGLGGISVGGVNRAAIPAADHDDENENDDADQEFMLRTVTAAGAAVGGGEFDDMLVWINAYELKANMVEAGALP